jgi:hypothetical protein
MPVRRPGLITALAILSIIFGGLHLLCALGNAAETKVTVNNRDVTQELKAFLNHEIPGYDTYRILELVTGMIVGVGLVVSGIGLFSMGQWARWLGVASAGVSILQWLFISLFQLLAVNPALNRFFGVFGPFNLGGIAELVGVVKVVFALMVVIFDVLLIIGLVAGGGARAFGVQRYGGYDDEYGEARRRPRRRPSWDEEDEDEEDWEDRPRRPPRRPPAEDEDAPPRRRPSRPRDEDPDEDDGGDFPRRGPRRTR